MRGYNAGGTPSPPSFKTVARPSRAVHPLLRLLRIGNVLVSLLGTLVGGLAAAGVGFDLAPGRWLFLGLAAGSTACVTAAGNILNDLGDRESDRTNHPDRPLVTGAVSTGSARALMLGLFGAAFVLVGYGLASHPAVGVILVVAVGVLLLYERRLKAVGFAGNLLVAFLTGAVFLYGAAAVGPLLPMVPFALMAFGATLSREVIKDMEDAGGDVDRRTLPQTHGFGLSSAVARVAVLGAIGLSALPFLYLLPVRSIVGIMYAATVVVADGVFLLSVRYLPKELHREQSTSKVAMSLALLAFLVTAFR